MIASITVLSTAMLKVITAVQMVVEEKFVSGLDIPALQAVGWEGRVGNHISNFDYVQYAVDWSILRVSTSLKNP